MAKFILAFKKILNLLSFSAPTEEQTIALADDETIAYVSESDEGSVSLLAVGNDGETIELAEGVVVSE